MPSNNMIHLVYVSTATCKMSNEELLFLLKQSRNRNKRQNVTGMLLYAGGNFFQVLEGERKDVEEIYETIVKDVRNMGNVVLLKEAIENRTFPEWSMGFSHLTSSDKAAVEGYSEFLERKMEPEEFANKADTIFGRKVLALLYQFKKGNV